MPEEIHMGCPFCANDRVRMVELPRSAHRGAVVEEVFELECSHCGAEIMVVARKKEETHGVGSGST